MECPICYDDINGSTGKAELSCSHSFHIRCLTTWFDRQNTNNTKQSCPCCRHESNEYEGINIASIDDQVARFTRIINTFDFAENRFFRTDVYSPEGDGIIEELPLDEELPAEERVSPQDDLNLVDDPDEVELNEYIQRITLWQMAPLEQIQGIIEKENATYKFSEFKNTFTWNQMEDYSATRIAASFKGYLVRKQIVT